MTKPAYQELEHWDICVVLNLDYFQGQISKYVFRWKEKGGITDLENAQHFLQKYIESEKEKLVIGEKIAKDLSPRRVELLIKDAILKKKNSYEEARKNYQIEGPQLAQQILQQGAPQLRYKTPISNEYYSYEGGTKDKDLYTCRKCKIKFETPLYGIPEMYHFHQEV